MVDKLVCKDCGAEYEPHYHCGQPMDAKEGNLVCVNGDYERPLPLHHGKPMEPR